jgi:hypothetical protein
MYNVNKIALWTGASFESTACPMKKKLIPRDFVDFLRIFLFKKRVSIAFKRCTVVTALKRCRFTVSKIWPIFENKREKEKFPRNSRKSGIIFLITGKYFLQGTFSLHSRKAASCSVQHSSTVATYWITVLFYRYCIPICNSRGTVFLRCGYIIQEVSYIIQEVLYNIPTLFKRYCIYTLLKRYTILHYSRVQFFLLTH